MTIEARDSAEAVVFLSGGAVATDALPESLCLTTEGWFDFPQHVVYVRTTIGRALIMWPAARLREMLGRPNGVNVWTGG